MQKDRKRSQLGRGLGLGDAKWLRKPDLNQKPFMRFFESVFA